MLPELGHFALAFAFAICAVQGPTLLLAGARAPAGYAAFAARASLLAFAAVALAFAALMHGYATSDFSLVNVYENSHTAKPFLFKLTGTWGNHEGSMLLWALVLTGFGAALAATSRRLPADLATPALGVQALIGAAFLAFLLFTSNPFERLSPTPADGTGLNPLLQDVGLAIHPPFLYLGYVGFSVPFSLAVAGLLAGRVDAAWGRAARPWALAAWSFLTVGITLGAWWAYYELGWGGWWAWDPVENASFMPWLVGTALIHSVRVVERRDALKAWAVLLAILAFSLSLVGTFLVRSGVLTSVHAFAVDPARGVFILAILAAAVGGSLTLYALRADKLSAGGAYAPVSREGALLFNNVLMAVAAATVFLGTFYPLFADVVSGAKISVGAPYFNAVFTPIAAATLALAAAGPLVAWKKGDLAFVGRRMAFAGAAALAGLVVALTLADRNAIAGALGVALAFWLAGG
ncbi:MAG: heme lyase CcmF/NrfE family subunit, partial [Pseudomonadota bacterium]